MTPDAACTKLRAYYDELMHEEREAFGKAVEDAEAKVEKEALRAAKKVMLEPLAAWLKTWGFDPSEYKDDFRAVPGTQTVLYSDWCTFHSTPSEVEKEVYDARLDLLKWQN